MEISTIIEPIKFADLPKIIDFGKKLHDDEKSYEPKLMFNESDSLHHYTKELSNPDALIVSARLENGEIAGYLYCYVHDLDYLISENVECVIEAIYVDMDYRNCGIGGQLMRYAEDWAIKTKNANRIKSHVYSDNLDSIKLHQKDGFKPYNIELIKSISDC